MSAEDPIPRLVAGWLDGTLSREEFRVLDERLRHDPAARAALRHAAGLDTVLRDWATSREISAAWSAGTAPETAAALTLPRRSRFRRWLWPLATAAAVALSVATYRFGTLAAPQPVGPTTRILADGTVVELNGAAEFVAEFTAAERRVRLTRGEAHFSVVKNPLRPFTVTAAGVAVRAVGTSFNVRLAGSAVEVLVTEGRVSLQPPPATAASAPSVVPPAEPLPAGHLLAARQRAVIGTGTAAAPEIATLTPGEIERVLAWQHRLLHFTATPLADIVAAFNRRNATQLVLADPELAALRVTASLRSDNVVGFVRLLETGFGVRSVPQGEAEIRLSRPP